MPAIGFLLAWLGYSATSWGYFLVRGYDVKFTDWVNPVHPYAGNPSDAGQIPPYQVIPGQGTASGASSSPGGSSGITSTDTGTRLPPGSPGGRL